RAAPHALQPHNAPDSAETAAPSTPATLPPPAPTTPDAPSGSKHREISAFSGPVAIPSGSSRCPLDSKATEHRTSRVLPNPDNSCATDTLVVSSLQHRNSKI